MFSILEQLNRIEQLNRTEFRGTTYVEDPSYFIMDDNYELTGNDAIDDVNKAAFNMLDRVENTTHSHELSKEIITSGDIKMYVLDIYRFGEKHKPQPHGNNVIYYGPLICLATLQISKLGKRIILYSRSQKHLNTAHYKTITHEKMTDDDAIRAIREKLEKLDFIYDLVQKARTKPAFDIAVGLKNDDTKY